MGCGQMLCTERTGDCTGQQPRLEHKWQSLMAIPWGLNRQPNSCSLPGHAGQQGPTDTLHRGQALEVRVTGGLELPTQACPVYSADSTDVQYLSQEPSRSHPNWHLLGTKSQGLLR